MANRASANLRSSGAEVGAGGVERGPPSQEIQTPDMFLAVGRGLPLVDPQHCLLSGRDDLLMTRLFNVLLSDFR